MENIRTIPLERYAGSDIKIFLHFFTIPSLDRVNEYHSSKYVHIFSPQVFRFWSQL
jgi:hypothetical protein